MYKGVINLETDGKGTRNNPPCIVLKFLRHVVFNKPVSMLRGSAVG